MCLQSSLRFGQAFSLPVDIGHWHCVGDVEVFLGLLCR
jgi:hypothetical protein